MEPHTITLGIGSLATIAATLLAWASTAIVTSWTWSRKSADLLERIAKHGRVLFGDPEVHEPGLIRRVLDLEDGARANQRAHEVERSERSSLASVQARQALRLDALEGATREALAIAGEAEHRVDTGRHEVEELRRQIERTSGGSEILEAFADRETPRRVTRQGVGPIPPDRKR